jgi:integrase
MAESVRKPPRSREPQSLRGTILVCPHGRAGAGASGTRDGGYTQSGKAACFANESSNSNPAAALRIPRKCQPGRDLRPLTEEEVNTHLEVFDLLEKLVARCAIFEGMRPGEILALRWKSVAGETIRVQERIYKRVFNTPKNGKTREGAMSDGTLELLKRWAELAQDPSPDGFVFPSEKLVTPVSFNNLWRRHMLPKLENIGLGWATFQVLRKTNASLSKKAGVDPKVASDQRGHGLGVSMEVTSSDMEQKRAAFKALEAAVLRKPKQPSELAKSA